MSTKDRKRREVMSMINYRLKAYMFLAAAAALLAAAVLSPHEEDLTDIVFLGFSFVSAAFSRHMFKNHREQKRFRSY